MERGARDEILQTAGVAP